MQGQTDHAEEQQIKQIAKDALTHHNLQLAEELADRLFELKKHQSAIDIYKTIIQNNVGFDYKIEGLGNNEEQVGYYEWNRFGWYKQERGNKRLKGSPYDALSLCCLDHNKYQEGIAWYKGMVQRHPSNYQIIFGYANILYNNGIYEQALRYYQICFKLKPTFVKPLVDIALLYEYQRINKRRSTEKAREVLQLQPENQYALFILGRNENDVDRKIEKLEKAWMLNVRYTRVCNEVGIAYGGTKKEYNQAIKWYIKCTEINPKYSSCYNNIGVNYQLLKRYQQAQKWYFKAIESDAQYKTAYKNLTDVFDQLHYSDDRILQESTLYKVNQSIFCYYLGLSYYDKQKVDKSIKWIQRGIVLNPSEHRFFNSLAISYDQKKDYEKAIQNYKRCIDLNPSYFSAYYNLAIVYKSMGNEDQAISWYTKSTEVNPRYSYAYNNLGNIYKKNGKYQQAIRYYEKAIEFNSTYTLAYINLGVCHLHIEQYKEASQVFANAQEIFNTDKNNLSQSNKEFIRPHLQKFQLEGQKWRKFSCLTPTEKQSVASIMDSFESSLEEIGGKLNVDGSIYGSKQLYRILREVVGRRWELDVFGEVMRDVQSLYKIDKGLFSILPWYCYQFFLRKQFIQKLSYQDIEVEIQNTLSSQVQSRLLSLNPNPNHLLPQNQLAHTQLPELVKPTPDITAFNIFEQACYFPTSHHLIGEIIQANNRASSHLHSFQQLLHALNEKVSKDCKLSINLRIPKEGGGQQFAALLSIVEQMFKDELGDGMKFEITACINQSLRQIKDYKLSANVIHQLYTPWLEAITTSFLKKRIKQNEQTYCYATDLIEAVCLLPSLKEIMAAVNAIHSYSPNLQFEVLSITNRLIQRGQHNITMILKKKSSLFKVRFELEQLHERMSFLREAKKMQSWGFGSILGCLVACQKGREYLLKGICMYGVDVLAGSGNLQEIELLNAAYSAHDISP